MQASTIQQIINHFITAFQQLDVQTSLREIESLATTIHKAMKTSTRSYHTPEHILHLADCSAPIQSLAALFHDIVYYQVDQGFSPEVEELLIEYIDEQDGGIRIQSGINEDDLFFYLTLEIFNLSPGQDLSRFNGQNEFLSALFMNRKLGCFLSLKLLAQTSAHIEATIPFRTTAAGELPWTSVLKRRLATLSGKFHIDFNPEELDKIICSAVQFANRDVDSFSEPDSGKFLSGTWELLPENNSSLRAERVYSIRDYRQALQKMEGFFKNLSPASIFHCYQDTPPREEYQRLQRIAHRNVTIAREYLGIKLLAIAVIEALAELTGGDAPLILFMGDLKEDGFLPTKLPEDFLSTTNNSSAAASNPLVSHLLEAGRSSESSFDIKHSPISFFLYKHLEPERIQYCLAMAQKMFHGKLNANDFLDEIGTPVVSEIASACAEMVVTRRKELLRYVHGHVKPKSL